VADIFDALILPRSYKKALSLENAIVELCRCVKKKEIDEEVLKILIDQVLIDSLMMCMPCMEYLNDYLTNTKY